jgi:DNA-binding Lrp family transcriptional regulator
LDTRDFEILRRLLEGVGTYSPGSSLASLRSVARDLHLDEGTVRNRIKRWREDGLLKGWNIFINPEAMGKKDAHLLLDVLPLSAKEDVIRKVRLLDGVYMIKDYYGSPLGVELLYEDEDSLRRKSELLARITNSESLECFPVPHPSCPIRFKETDISILKSMRNTPWKPFSKTSEETGLSRKTVKRRLDRLMSARAFLFYPSIDYSALRGLVRGDLIVVYSGTESKSAVDAAIMNLMPERVLAAHFEAKAWAFCAIMIPNLAEGKKLIRLLREIPGVRAVRIDLIEQTVEIFNILSVALDSPRVPAYN